MGAEYGLDTDVRVPRTHSLRKALTTVRRLSGQLAEAARLDDSGDFFLKACLLRELRVATDRARKLGRAHVRDSNAR